MLRTSLLYQAEDRRVNPNKKGYLETAATRARNSELGLILCPSPNTESAAFIAGPGAFSRELQVPENVLKAWQRANKKAIYKAARKLMNYYPPREKGSRSISLATKEFATVCFRTLYIRTDSNPSPVAVGWKRKDGRGPGTWNVIELQGGTTAVTAGFGSYPVTKLFNFFSLLEWYGMDSGKRWNNGRGAFEIKIFMAMRVLQCAVMRERIRFAGAGPGTS